MNQNNPPHPGEILKTLWLEPENISVTALALRLKVSRKTLSEIVNQRAGLTAEMALRLELALGKSAGSWLAHQADYDLWQLQSRREQFAIEAIAG